MLAPHLEEMPVLGRPFDFLVLEMIARFMPKDGKGFVFPGNGKTGHFVGLPKVLARVAKRAGIAGMNIKRLRKWFASTGTRARLPRRNCRADYRPVPGSA